MVFHIRLQRYRDKRSEFPVKIDLITFLFISKVLACISMVYRTANQKNPLVIILNRLTNSDF